jgi:hypothetical protein
MRRGSGAPIDRRFWARVQVTGAGCWLWQGARSASGYGNFKPRRGLRVSAHRIAWELVHGAIPDGLCVLHRCDVKPCVNPAHLWLGTIADNNADRAAKGRSRHQDGEANSCARLTAMQVREIRRRYERGSISQSALARVYAISQTQISRIMTGAQWRQSVEKGS